MSITYTFKNPELLTLALSHRSIGKKNNERLEFLGDATLNLIISQWLFEHDQYSEGQLSRLRANLVNQTQLEQIATTLQLDQQLQASASEYPLQPSLLADAVEAIIGAVLLDGGFEAAKAMVLNWYEHVLQQPIELLLKKDAKTTLQEHCQQQRLPLPQYALIAVTGQAHAQTFAVEASIDGFTAQGNASTKKQAEQLAAEAILAQLEEHHD
jgi:ribonuclease-3